MFNRFLGKNPEGSSGGDVDPPGSTTAPVGSTGGNDASNFAIGSISSVGGCGAPQPQPQQSSETAATENNTNTNTNNITNIMSINTTTITATAATTMNETPTPKEQEQLQAVTIMGNHYSVRVSVNDANVSPPGSDVEDNEDMMMMMMMEGSGGGGLERTHSGSTRTSTTSTSLLDNNNQDPTADNNDAMDEDAPAPRRGRSASIGEAGEIPENNDNASGGMFSRDTSTSSAADPMHNAMGATEGQGAGGSSNFEASLLLGIAAEASAGSLPSSSGVSTPLLPESKEKREPIDPTTLPTSMTSFLDMLTEDQRRVRHRHIPGVDGFRKLYKSEVKSDIAEARRMKKAKHLTAYNGSVSEEKESGELDHMEVDGEATSGGLGGGGGLDGDDKSAVSDNITPTGKMTDEKEENKLPDRDAFIAPDKDAMACANGGQLASLLDSSMFENEIKGNSGKSVSSGSGDTMRSPRLVDSMTSFNPPRPQESMASKTKSRLKRWELHPNEVESDLAKYRNTVSRVREEVHAAKAEHAKIESVAALMRNHFMAHLNEYRSEVLAVNEQLAKVHTQCFKLEEECNGRSMSTRGKGRGINDILTTLKGLGDDSKGVSEASSGSKAAPKDWRVMGIGGVSMSMKEKTMTGSGWLLVGDEVIVTTTGVEGTVVSVKGPEVKVEQKKKDAAASSKKKAEDGSKKKPDPATSTSKAPETISKGGDAMDVDTPSKKKDESPKKEDEAKGTNTSLGTTIDVKLAKDGQVKSFSPAEVEFNPKKLPTLLHSNPALAKRWEDMVSTALAHGINHDQLAMEEYINASFVPKELSINDEEDGKGDKNDGSASPKSVAQYEDERLLAFGAELIAAPEDIKNYPSVIPLDNLEETVRKVVFEADTPRIIPDMPQPVRKYEAQAEEVNTLRGRVLQLRNRVSRQKRLRSLNERSLVAGKSRAHKVEGLLLEMQMDLKSLKERLQDELNELGIGKSPLPTQGAPETEKEGNADENVDMKEDAPKEEEAKLKSSQAKPADTVNMATDNVEEQTELDTKDDDKKAEPESAEATKEGALLLRK